MDKAIELLKKELVDTIEKRKSGKLNMMVGYGMIQAYKRAIKLLEEEKHEIN